jgi:signal transduction histidine kinase
VFDEFSRGRAARDSGAPGLGLGLAFVRTIIRGHRGKITLASRPDGGTEFRIRLRRAGAAPRATTAATAATAAPTAASAPAVTTR